MKSSKVSRKARNKSRRLMMLNKPQKEVKVILSQTSTPYKNNISDIPRHKRQNTSKLSGKVTKFNFQKSISRDHLYISNTLKSKFVHIGYYLLYNPSNCSKNILKTPKIIR